jgi:hypothetical protein
MEYTLMELVRIGAPLLAIGGAWGGAKVALNGTRQRVKVVEENQATHESKDEERHIETIDRLARIETKLDRLQ